MHNSHNFFTFVLSKKSKKSKKNNYQKSKIQKKMKRVLKFVDQSNAQFKIVHANQIEVKDWSEVYDQYGIQQSDEKQGIESPMIEYWDGSNFQTAVIADGVYPHPTFEYADAETENEILAELKAVDFSDYERGVATATTENYTFKKSLWSNAFGIDVY